MAYNLEPGIFSAIESGACRLLILKTSGEIRVGSRLELEEYDYTRSRPTGRRASVEVTYKTVEFSGLKDGHCALSVNLLP